MTTNPPAIDPTPPDATQAAALAYYNAGFNIIPVMCDGSKSPLKGLTWTKYQTKRPHIDLVTLWFDPKFENRAIAGLTGKGGGNWELADTDLGELFPVAVRMIQDEMPGFYEKKISPVQTPREGGGFHAWVQWQDDVVIPGNHAIAKSADGKKVFIETRGEGGYALLPGSPLTAHKTGNPYVQIGGPPLTEKRTEDQKGTAAEYVKFHEILSRFDKFGLAEKRKQAAAREAERAALAAELATHPADCDCRHHAKAKAGPHGHACGAGALRPGDDYDRRGPEWKDILEPAGWRLDHSVGGVDHWTRPGKREGVSATTGHARTPDNLPLLYVFSSNAHPFDSETSYSKFSAYTTLHHGGDFSAAARALAAMGYGSGFTDEFANIDVSNFDFVAAAQNDTRTPAERAADLWAQSAFVAGDAAAGDAAAGVIRDPLPPAMTNSPEPPPPPGPDTTCVRPHGVHLERLRDCVWMYIWVDCGRPSCPGCAIKWKMLRRQHIRRHAGEIAEANPLATMFVFNAAGKAKWKTVHKHISRQFARHEQEGRSHLHGFDRHDLTRHGFARLDMNGDNYYLGVSTVHPGPSATNVVEMKPELAAERMCGAIDAMPLIDKAHAYTTSRNWPVIPDSERDRKSEWRRISRITTAAPVVHEILTARGANIKFVASRENKIKTHFGYLFDPAVCNVSSEHLAAEVSLGELLPEGEVEAVNGGSRAAPRDTLDVLGWGESTMAFAGGVTLNASGDVTVF